ncbi:MAG: hypothetical protein RL660_1432 [Bacteroidota bacterium]|jgi:hypothetical protein
MKRITYYSIKNATEREKIGCWPQLEPPKRYWKVENNYDKALDYRKFPQVKPNLDNFSLKRIAKRTDVLSAEMPGVGGCIGLFVSEKFKRLVENYNLKDFRFYDCKLISPFDEDFNNRKEPEVFNFNFLNFIHSVDIIDFKRSVFENLKTNEMITIENEEERTMFLHPRQLFLKETPDLFCSPYGISILVSEQLKTAIEEAGITGIWFEDRIACEFYGEA